MYFKSQRPGRSAYHGRSAANWCPLRCSARRLRRFVCQEAERLPGTPAPGIGPCALKGGVRQPCPQLGGGNQVTQRAGDVARTLRIEIPARLAEYLRHGTAVRARNGKP